MWLPNAFYDRAPHYWVFVGLLLIILGVYLGIEMNQLFLIFGVGAGVLSCLWGFRIYLRRSKRQEAKNAPAAD